MRLEIEVKQVGSVRFGFLQWAPMRFEIPIFLKIKMNPLQQLLNLVQKEEGEKWAQVLGPSSDSQKDSEQKSQEKQAESKDKSISEEHPPASPKKSEQSVVIQGQEEAKEEAKKVDSVLFKFGEQVNPKAGNQSGKQKKVNVVGNQKKLIKKVDKRQKQKKEEEDAKGDNPLFSFDKLFNSNKRAAPIAPHRQAHPQSNFKQNEGSQSVSFDKPVNEEEEEKADKMELNMAKVQTSSPVVVKEEKKDSNSNKVQELLKKVLDAQDKQVNRINSLERQLNRSSSLPFLQKMEKKILQKIQDHVEGSVRKALQKLPESLAYKVHQQVMKSLTDIVQKGFNESITSIMLPQLEHLVEMVSPSLIDPITKLLSVLKEKMHDQDVRSQSLEKFFIQTIDALESAVEQIEQQNETQKEYFEQLKKESESGENKSENKKDEDSKQRNQLDHSLSSKDINSDTRSVIGAQHSPFTPRDTSPLFASTLSLHERDETIKGKQDPRLRIQAFLKAFNYQKALEMALATKKEDIIIESLDLIPDKLATVNAETLGEAFRFLSSNWKPNASADIGKKIIYLKQLEVFKDYNAI